MYAATCLSNWSKLHLREPLEGVEEVFAETEAKGDSHGGVDKRLDGAGCLGALRIMSAGEWPSNNIDTVGSRLRMESFAFERHYRVKELAGLWGLSPKTISRIFAEEAGVIRVANDGTNKRKYATLSIPESVASRVHERLRNPTMPETLIDTRSVRIIRLGDRPTAPPGGRRSVIRVKS